MQILGTTPTPLPTYPKTGGSGSPKEWKGKTLVAMTYQLPEAKTPVTTIAVGNGSFEKVPGSLVTAVELASARAQKGRTHAVLQASDGAFYITALLNRMTSENSGVPIDSDVRKGVKFLEAAAENAAVKAIVGAKTWVNFTADSIQPVLAG